MIMITVTTGFTDIFRAFIASSGQAFAQSTTGSKADFNGDGYADFAVGVPSENIGSIDNAGAVNVIYGSLTGLSATAKPDQVWSQASGGINDNPEKGDMFGASVSHGDFNNDGYSDLAIGTPGEDVGSSAINSAGGVSVIYGSTSGLKSSIASDGSGRPDQFWHQNVAAIEDSAEAGDQFGHSLASGDFDGDSYDDLAIGISGEDGSGAVAIIYGSSSGLSASAAQVDRIIRQAIGGDEDQDLFGWSLASGNFNDDAFSDLAIGVPGEDVSGSVVDAGAVHIMEGSPSGISAASRTIFSQGADGIDDMQESGDGFGRALATGDFNADDYDDLVVGVPFEDIVTLDDDAGAVNAIYGSSGGLSSTVQADGSGMADQFWHQFDPSEIPLTQTKDGPIVVIQHPAAQLKDEYGSALAAGDFDGDGDFDLAIGVPGESVAGIGQAGSANMLYGSIELGLQDQAPHDQNWHQNSSGVQDSVEAEDRFGNALAAGDFNNDGYCDLAIGVAAENIGSISDAGAVNVIYGSPTTLRATASGTTPDDQLWSQNTKDVDETSESGDSFGTSLT
jgi:FG-GAP repeat protein